MSCYKLWSTRYPQNDPIEAIQRIIRHSALNPWHTRPHFTQPSRNINMCTLNKNTLKINIKKIMQRRNYTESIPDQTYSLARPQDKPGRKFTLRVKFLSLPPTVHCTVATSACPYSYRLVAYFISIVDITTAHCTILQLLYLYKCKLHVLRL